MKTLNWVMCFAVVLAQPLAGAIGFSGDFLQPYEFLDGLPSAERTTLAPAVASTVLIAGHATGFLISADGWMVTAAHTLYDLAIGPTKDCARIKLWLNHAQSRDGTRDGELRRLECDEVRELDVRDDFALLRVHADDGLNFEGHWLPVARGDDSVQVGEKVYVSSHPHAMDYEKAQRRVTSGQVILLDPTNEQLPHFLHLVDTEEGSSGAPVFNDQGQVVGLHIRGVRGFSEGVHARVDGKETVVHDFNIAVWMPYLAHKYGL